MPDKPFVADAGRSRSREAKQPADADAVHLTIDFDEDEPAAVNQETGWDEGEGAVAQTAAPPGPQPRKAQPISDASEPPAGQAATTRRKPAAAGMPAMLAGIEVTLSVEIGSHRLPLRDLLSVDPGQLFPLDRMTSEPVSILVNGKPFARGEVVAIGDRFGVRLLDIVSQDLA